MEHLHVIRSPNSRHSQAGTTLIEILIATMILAFGLMTRAAPQLNIFSIGFPLTLVLGQVIVWIGMADILAQYQGFVAEALAMMRELIGVR